MSVRAAGAGERDPEETARETVLRLLTGQPRTRAQLAAALARKGVPEDVAERVLDRFEELGLVDDAAFAEVYVRSRHAGRGLSRRALALELQRKGVDGETAGGAVAALSAEDEEETALRLARRRAAATRHLDREVRGRRIAAALLRRGYPAGLATRAALAALEAEGGTEGVPDGDPLRDASDAGGPDDDGAAPEPQDLEG